MKTLRYYILVALLALPSLCHAAADARLQVKKATDIKILPRSVVIGLVHDDAKITFTANAEAIIHLVAIDQNDEKNRFQVAGRRATTIETRAENCEFTLYRPRYAGHDDRSAHMNRTWDNTVKAAKALQEGKSIGIHFYAPDIQIRHNVIKKISGIGNMHVK